MLSATIDSPENFADWIEKEKINSLFQKYSGKENDSCTNTKESFLLHIICGYRTSSVLKSKKYKYSRPFKDFTNKLVPIKTPDGTFHLDNFNGVTKTKTTIGIITCMLKDMCPMEL